MFFQLQYKIALNCPEGLLAGDSDEFATLFFLSVPLHPRDPYRFTLKKLVLETKIESLSTTWAVSSLSCPINQYSEK